ncbi:MAG: zinc ribbon domain-containing protein [Thermoplasmatota archaeon]
MNLHALGIGILFIIIAIVIIIVTFGFGIICIWPLLILGGFLFIIGLFSPSQKTMIQRYQSTQQQQPKKMKRICSNCQKTVPLNVKKCPHCGHQFKYD